MRGQSKATEQSNLALDTATISAQLTQLIAIITVMIIRMKALEARFGSPTLVLPTVSS